MASVARNLDARLARQRGVRDAVRAEAEEIAGRARGRLATHKETGAASIEVTHGAVDSLVELVDPAALSIEFGRGAYTRPDGQKVGPMAGLHVLGGAI